MAAVATGVGLPSFLRALPVSTPLDITPRAGDPLLKTLAQKALDAATAAGASYADVRFTITRQQSFYFGNPPNDSENIAVGVRALANGAWGFTASPEWTPEVLTRLGKTAAEQARGNAWSGRPGVDLGERPPTVTGEWHMPVKRDPFAIAVEEKLDYIRSAEAYARTFRNGSGSSIIIFERQERTFASTDGSFVTQTVYTTFPQSFFAVGVSDPVTRRGGSRSAQFVSPTGAGYEIFEDAKLLDQIPRLYEEAKELMMATPQDGPGSFDIVFDGYAMASIVDNSLGAALELDRAMGYEANAAGTSYLAPPDTILGTAIVPPVVTVTAERSAPTGAATVKWDAEGVVPSPFTLIKNGVAVDYATSREFAQSLSSWYGKQHQPVRSNGCAGADDAMAVQLIQAPNTTLQPDTKNTSFEDLVAGVDKGLAVLGGQVLIDHQQLNGQGFGEMVYAIKKGKLAGTVSGAAYLFRSPQFWKNLVALGGAQTSVTRGFQAQKGQPQQTTSHSVTAVAAHIKDVRVMDIRASTEAARMRMMP